MKNLIATIVVALAALATPSYGQVCLLADGFEPNNSCATATTINPLCQTGLTVKFNDPDWFRVQVPPQHEAIVGLVVDDPQAIVQLLGTRGCAGPVNLNVGIAPLRSSYILQNTSASTVDQAIRVAIFNTAFVPCTTYTISIRVLPISQTSCSSMTDSLEPNDCCDAAVPMPTSSAPPVLLVRVGDPDWFEFTLAGGDTSDVYLSTHSNGSPFMMELFDFCGSPAIQSDSNFLTATNVSFFPTKYWVKVTHTGASPACAGYDVRSTLRPALQTFCNSRNDGCISCPCGNQAPNGTVGGCLNGAGTSANLLASGTASVAADTLRFEAEKVTPMAFGILVSGARRAPANPAHPCYGFDLGLQSPSYDGLRCVVQGLLRHGGRPSDSSGDIGMTNNGWGQPNGPAGGIIANGGFVVGQSRHFQLIYRDAPDAQCMRGLNTSNAVSVTIFP